MGLSLGCWLQIRSRKAGWRRMAGLRAEGGSLCVVQLTGYVQSDLLCP